MHQVTILRSNLAGIGHAVVATFIGLVGLPLVSGTTAAPPWVWLALASAVCIWLLAPAPTFIGGLERLLARAPLRGGPVALAPSVRMEIARLLLAVVYVVVLQAIVRRPLVTTLGAGAEPFVVEASFAVFALTALVILLGWIHRAGRPLVEGIVRFTLDALLATSGSEVAAARAERTHTHADASAPTILRTRDQPAQATLAGHTMRAGAIRTLRGDHS